MKKANYIANKLYYINLILLMLKIYYSVSDIIAIPKILSKSITFFIIASFMCILFIKTLSKRFSKKQNIIYYSILAICFFSSIVSRDYNIVLSYLLVICIKDIDLKKVLKIILTINVVMLLIHVCGYILNLIFKFKDVVIYYTDDGNVIHNFLVGHPNHFALLLFWTYATYMYIRYEKIKYTDYILGIILAIFLYIVPQSRTTSLASCVLIFLIFASKLNKEKINWLIKTTSKYIFILFIICTIIIIPPYKKMNEELRFIVDKIDAILSGRILYPHAAYEIYGYTIIGEYIDYEEIQCWGGPIIMDNLYGKILYNYGVFYAVLIGYLLISKNKQLKNEEHIYVIMFSIIAICEVHVLNACIGITLLMIGDIVQNRGVKNERIN